LCYPENKNVQETIMRHIKLLLFLLCFIWILPLQAQDNFTPYEIALQRIEEARISGATRLDLAYLGLSELPPEIGQLVNLRRLYLNNNYMRHLPIEIRQLPDLKWLIISDNNIEHLSAEISQLSNLEGLSLGSNQLRQIPAEIGQLTNLINLNLGAIC
jgi:Leucine-rich repeat (LRR) protein